MSRKLRLALVTAFPPGRQSLNEYGLHLARALAESEDVAELVILADRLDGKAPELQLSDKIRVRRVWGFNRFGTSLTLVNALRRERVDGVIYNLQVASFGDREMPAALGLLAPMLSRAAGIPSGVILHNLIAAIDLEQTLLKGQKLRQRIVTAGAGAVTWALCRASYVTVTLKSYADHLARRYPRARSAHVPHGSFETRQGDWIPLGDRPQTIVTMGKFGTYKRLETLLRAFDLLRAHPDHAGYRLVIGGSDHPNAPGYLAALEQDRAADNGVCFAGYLPEEQIPDFFARARLSVFDYESTTGSSGVLHQTASHGAVPVFPRIGDFVDLCEGEGLRGYHYRPGSAEDMARAMIDALNDPEGAEALALSNREAAQGLSISDVAAWHVARLGALSGGADS